jgi:hypothetical protein
VFINYFSFSNPMLRWNAVRNFFIPHDRYFELSLTTSFAGFFGAAFARGLGAASVNRPTYVRRIVNSVS